MQKSKRLLSILLMLTMLVSMFTVMAFAKDSTAKVKVAVHENGKVNVNGVTAQSNVFYVDVGDSLTAIPDEGFTAKWYFGATETDILFPYSKDATIEATEDMVDTNGSILGLVVKFTKSEEPPVTPPQTQQINLKLDIKTNGVAGAKVFFRDTQDITGNANDFAIYKEDLDKGMWFFTTSAEQEYKVSWKLNGTEVSNETRYDLLNTLKAGNNILTVTFEKKTTPVEEKYPLTVVVETVSGVNYGTVKYNGNQGTVLTDSLVAGAKVTAEAVAKSGYKFVKWVADGVTLTNTELKNEKLTFTMPKNEVKVTAVFAEVSSSSRTLTLDITRSSYGSVKWKWPGEKTYKPATDNYTWTLTEGDEITFVLNPDYGVVWQLDDSRRYYSETFTLDFDDLDADGSTLYVAFDKKGSSPSYDKSYTLTIDITGAKHGTVKRGSATVKDGDTISLDKNETCTFKASPDKGYVAVWTFQGETYVGNSYTVKMGSKNATLYVEFMDEDDYRLTKLPFRDVSKGDWFYDDVVYVYRNGYMEGVSSTKFAPNQYTTRGQIVTILWRLTGEPRAAKENKFYDVSSKMYYDKAISWAAEAGIVDGFDAHTFKPDENVTREQLAAILYRYADYMNLSTKGASNLTKFDDYNKIGTWARDAMAWANYHGLINGVSYSRIDPKGNATRAQVAAILHRFAVEFGA